MMYKLGFVVIYLSALSVGVFLFISAVSLAMKLFGVS